MKTNKLLVATLSVITVVLLVFGACSAPAATPTTVVGQTNTGTGAPPPSITLQIPPQADKGATRPPTTYAPSTTYASPTMTVPAPTTTSPVWGTTPSSPNQGTIGLATGGAKDVVSFRANIQNNYLPLPTDLTYEGLFYDYYFDTGITQPATKLYVPSYSYAATRDPLSGQTEYYLSVGLNSGLKESDFQRKKLNLVIVLDTSGSMGEYFDQYYYDRYGKRIDAYADEGVNRQRKIDSAKDAVVTVLDQLNPDDSFAIVLFNSGATLAKPMGLVSRTNMRDITNHVLDLVAGGSTDMSAGMNMAMSQFRGLSELNNYEHENRIILLTDAQPNTGDFSASGLSGMVAQNAGSRIYTTFIGIGVDFNSQLIELLTKTKGANYYSVHSPSEFRQRMTDEFDFMVTPLVFNLRLDFQSDGWRIDKVFGSPEADTATGNLMTINTLFPSKSEGGENKGGLVLLKLRKISSQANSRIYLRTSYEDRNGRRDGSESIVVVESSQPEYFGNTGIRKGILLARYAALLKNWMIDERGHIQYSRPWDPYISEKTGILLPVENVGQWERTSLQLTVSPQYRTIFGNFSRYFTNEMNAIGDYSLDQELAILKTLAR